MMPMLRKAIYFSLLLLLVSSVALFPGCKGFISGSGELEVTEYDLSNFAHVEISNAFQYEVSQSSFYRVTVTADDNLVEYLQVTKTGERLQVGLKPDYVYVSTHLKVVVTMPDLHSLDISGASAGFIEGFNSSHDLAATVSGVSSLDLVDISCGNIDFDVSGVSGITGDISAANARFTISGAGRVQLAGSALDLIADASGASRVELGSFIVNNADVSLSGASYGTVQLSGRLDADLSGLSHLTYIGEPVFGTINTSGGSILSQQ